MNPVCFDGIFIQQGLFLLEFFLRTQIAFLYIGEFDTDVGQHKKFGILPFTGDGLNAFIGEIDGIIFFINAEIQFTVHLGHFLLLVG